MAVKPAGGFALIAALFVMLLLGILGVTLAGLYSTFSKTVAEGWKGQRALAVADGGMRWVFQHQFADDRNFSDNLSPTDAPFGANAMTLGPGRFWVEYDASTKTQTTVDITVTGQVDDAVRVVKAQLRVKAAKPLRKVLYASGGISFTDSTSGTISGDVETQGDLYPLPAGGSLTYVNGTVFKGSPYRRFLGVDLTPFLTYADLSSTGDLTLDGASSFPLGNPPGNYGDVNGYIRYVSQGNVTLKGGLGPITINGTIVVTAGGQPLKGQIIFQDSPTVTWTARAKNIDADAALEMPPAFVADSVDILRGSNLDIVGLVCSRVGTFQWSSQIMGDPRANFTLNGLLLAGGAVAVWTGVGGPKLTMTHDSQWNTPWGLDVPWLDIQGPDVEYEFAQWREQVAPPPP